MKQAILNVLQNYLNRTSAIRVYSPDEISIFQDIPEFFREALGERKNEFKILGSIGQGNLAEVPWVSILHKGVTETPQKGIYIVLLFAADMSGLYLSLNQGVTDFKSRFGTKKRVLNELRKSALTFQQQLNQPIQGISDVLHLKSKTLGSFYSAGNIQAFYYPKDSLPSAEQFKKDFLVLLASYDQIIQRKGTEIREEDFQLYVNECASIGIKRSDLVISQPTKQTTSVTKFKRNLKVSAFALQEAQFCCEVDSNHRTFTAKRSGKNYMEAHHLIPLSLQNKFSTNLDTPENIVSLCPNCHKLVHLGIFSDKKDLLLNLFKKRMNQLKKYGINLSETEFLSFYDKD